MELFLVRHGQTQGNIDGRLMGWQDIELTAEGERQAELTGQALYDYAQAQGLTINALYSSPLRRTMRTARAIAARFGLEPIADPDLREINFGQIEGLTPDEWHERFPELALLAANADDREFSWPDGETRGSFYDRARDAIGRLAAAHGDDENIVLVSHGGVISAFVAHLAAGNPARWRDYRTDNCSITRLTVSGGQISSPSCLVSFNDVSHLGEIERGFWPKTT